MPLPSALFAALLALSTTSDTRADCQARWSDADPDGKPDELILENEFLRLVFTPQGAGKAFIHKPSGTDVLGGQSSGLFHWDVLELPDWQSTSQGMPRETRIAKDSAEEAAVELSVRMPRMVSRPKYDRMVLSQTLSVRKGVSAVFGQVTARNEADEDQPITFREGIRKHSPGVIWGTYVPDIEGPRVAMDLEPGPYSFPALSGSFPSAWLGGVNEKGFGLAASFEWKYIDMVECWCSKSPDATFQWAYRSQALRPGQSWTTPFTLTCFQGFEEVTGMCDGVVGQLEVGEVTWDLRKKPEHLTQFPPIPLAVGQPVPVDVRLTAISPRQLTVELGSRRLPDRDLKVEKTAAVSVDGQTTASAAFAWTPASEGTHVVTARVLDQGREVLRMEKPFVLGVTDQAYFAEMPQEEPIGEPLIGQQIAEPPLHDAAVTLDLEAVAIPRKAFGRNFINGPLSLLFVCQPKHDLVSAREIYQRMDATLDHLVVPEGNRGGTRRLLEHLSATRPRVFFLSGYRWQKAPALTLTANIVVQGRVSQGMGLVLLASHGLLANPKTPLAQFLARAQPVENVPFLEEIPGQPVPVKLYTLGKGRIAVLDGTGSWAYDSAIPSQRVSGLPPAFFFWDYGLSEWVKAIHWVARHETDLRFTRFRVEDQSLAFDLLRAEETAERPVLVQWKLLDAWAREEASGLLGVTLGGAGQSVSLPLRNLPGGKHLAEVSIHAPGGVGGTDAGRVLRWASHLFETPPVVQAAIDFTIKGRHLEPGEPVQGHILLTQRKPAVRTLDVELRIDDAWGRAIRQEGRRLSFSETEFRMPFSFDLWPDCRHDRHVLDVTVRAYERVFSRERAPFSLRWRPHLYLDDFAVGMWTTPGDDLLGYVTSLGGRRVGMNYFYYDHPFDPHARRYIGPQAFEMGGAGFKQDNKTLTCSPSLCDEKTMAELKASFRKAVESQAAGDVRFWMLQDERSFRGEYDYSEPTLAAFRTWLQEEYGGLDALNREWNTSFSSWGGVRPVTREEFESRKLDKGNLSPWLDFRLFMGKVWADWTRHALEVVKKVCPSGEVGMGGIFAPSVWSGVDIWLATRYARVGARYNGMQEEWYHSFAPDSAVGQWGGYSPLEPSPANLLHPWRQLFHEGHFAWYYKYYANPGGYAYQGAFNCDGTLHGMYNALIQEHRDIQHGIGRLLLNSRWLDDGISLPYSQSTLLANEFLGLPQTVYTLKSIVENLGYQHRFLAYAQIEAGELLRKERGVRLLLLPAMTCLSSREVEAIRQFVSRGGVLVADRLAGTRDEHGRTWPGASPLDEIFGIVRRPGCASVQGQVKFGGRSAPPGLRGRAFEMTVAESDLEAAGAEPWAHGPQGVPVVLVHRYKKGRTVYLNLDVTAYQRMQGGGAVRPELISEASGDQSLIEAMDEVFGGVLAAAGIGRPRVAVRSASTPGSLGESFFWSRDDHLYFGFRPSVSTSTEASLDWDSPGHLYNLRTGRYHGWGRQIALQVFPGRALVLSRLPYRVLGLSVQADRAGNTACHPGETLVVDIRVLADAGRPGQHVFRVDVTDGAGNEAGAHGGNFDAPEGRFRLPIPLALNAAEGGWTLRVRDAASGVTAVHRFEVARVASGRESVGE